MAKKTAGNAVIDEIVRRPYTVEVVYGETAEDGVLAQIAEWPGCMTAGDTRTEALARIEDAMRDWAEARLADGSDVPGPMADYRGSILLRLAKTLHRDAAKRAQREGVSLNQWIATTIARAVDAGEDRAAAMTTKFRSPAPASEEAERRAWKAVRVASTRRRSGRR